MIHNIEKLWGEPTQKVNSDGFVVNLATISLIYGNEFY